MDPSNSSRGVKATIEQSEGRLWSSSDAQPEAVVIVDDYDELLSIIRRDHPNQRIACTIGSFDILHWGHVDYLREARSNGDVLVVGVDSDQAYARYKRREALYPQRDRQEIVAALRYADYVTVIDDVDDTGEWQMQLVRTLRPDVFVCNDRSYSKQQQLQLELLCSTLKSIPFRTPTTTYSSSAVAEHLRAFVQKLNWIDLTPGDFEELVFLLVSSARNYENTQWLQDIHSPDRGRDISAYKVDADDLCGTRRLRVIIQCKHRLSKSVSATDIGDVRTQMELWAPPRVDILVVASSGRFTLDAVQLVEKHNQENTRLHIVLWPESHLQLPLARRPELIERFGLIETISN